MCNYITTINSVMLLLIQRLVGINHCAAANSIVYFSLDMSPKEKRVNFHVHVARKSKGNTYHIMPTVVNKLQPELRNS